MLVVSKVSNNDEMSFNNNTKQIWSGQYSSKDDDAAHYTQKEQSLSSISTTNISFEDMVINEEPLNTHTDLITEHAEEDLNNVEVEYIEASQNFQGNYQNYVSMALKSIIPLRKMNFAGILATKKFVLPEPPAGIKKTLILDLDETLVHADFDHIYSNHDCVVSFKFDVEDISVPIFIRPGFKDFLTNISEFFEIFIFTASMKEYADAVLNYLDPENKFFRFRFYRSDCICVKSKFFIKDLRIFQNRKEENLVIVDNSLYSFANQISNGVLINSFYNDKSDRELFNLQAYLIKYLQNIDDVRSINEQVFNFNSIINEFIFPSEVS